MNPKNVFHDSTFNFSSGVLVVALLVGGCSDKEKKEASPTEARRAAVSADGRIITIGEGSPGLEQLKVAEIRTGRALISAIAPARVVASISSSLTSPDKIILFESPDITTLYSQFRQAKANAERTAKNLARIRDMFANQGATSTDLTNAETDAATARASIAEMEGRLRAFGFNPNELEQVSLNSVWLISDVAETQLNEVQKGEKVDVWFSSLPGKKFTGRATAVGDIVDPMTRTVKVRVTLPNNGGKFLPGMFARVDFGDPRDGVIILPTTALVTVEDKDFVFVETRPGEFQRREVVTQNANPTEVVVVSGLQSGERVVISGAMLLKGLSFGF